MEGKQYLIIFLDQMRLQAAVNETTIKSWDFPKELVRDGKISKRPEFASQLAKFLSASRIGATTVLLLLSDAICFTHTVKAEETTEKEQHARNFYDMLPVESAIKHEYEMGRDILLVACDSEFVKTVIESLITYGCTIGSVVPAAVLPEVGAKRWLDAAYVQYVQKNGNALSKWTILGSDQIAKHIEEPEKEIISKKNKPPYGLIAVFAVLVVVLILMVVFLR